jgi:hypothetical protein
MIQKSHRQKGDFTVYSLLQNNYEHIKGVVDDYNFSEQENNDGDNEDDNGQPF